MRINKQGRINGTHTQHRISLMVDDENWRWYQNLKNKARAINNLMKKEWELEDRQYIYQIKEEDSQ